MGEITLRSDGRWCGTLQVGGVRRYVYGKTEREAKKKLAELERQASVVGLADPGKRTVGDLLDHWLEIVRPTLKARTVADYESLCRRYIRRRSARAGRTWAASGRRCRRAGRRRSRCRRLGRRGPGDDPCSRIGRGSARSTPNRIVDIGRVSLRCQGSARCRWLGDGANLRGS